MRITIARSIVAAGACLGSALAIQPAYAEPAVRRLLIEGVEVLIVSGTAAGAALLVGGVAHQFAAWGRSLPPAAPALPVQFANDQEAVELARVEHEADPEDERATWTNSILQFAFMGGRYGFSWRNIRRFVPNNADWQRGIEVLTTSYPPVLAPARGNIPPRWATGWYYSKFRIAVRWGSPEIELPYSTGERALSVDWHRTARSWTNANERNEH